MSNGLFDRAADAFAAALGQWRAERGLTKKRLAAEMGFDPSYVSHVEARRHRPTEDFARRAEAVLRAGGEVWQRFLDYDDIRQSTGAGPATRAGPQLVVPEQRLPPTAGLLVEHELSQLSYVDASYRCVIRRHLHNVGSEPVTRYPVRIAVDRYPGEPERSNRYYRDHPLTWRELNLDARRGDEPMAWRPKHDRDAFKEIWLLFENSDARFPLYPGQRAIIEYAYTVGEDKWGHWFQRAVRLPTGRLSVHLDFPAELRTVVWGVETSMTAEAGALKTPVTQRRDGDRTVFDWSTEDPPLNARYRLEWRFRELASGTAGHGRELASGTAGHGRELASGTTRYGRELASATARVEVRPSELMRGAGILQRGAPMLDRAAKVFELPDQAALADDIVARLLDALRRVQELHEFGKGMGLAAPQLGIGWAAAVIQAPADDEGGPVALLNPRVVGESVDHDEQYEGCLSFFDVRGVVSRPLLVEVEHEDLAGVRRVTTFTRAMARLVAHEVDHLGGLLYPDRMPRDGRLVPVEEYHDQGQPWRY